MWLFDQGVPPICIGETTSMLTEKLDFLLEPTPPAKCLPHFPESTSPAGLAPQTLPIKSIGQGFVHIRGGGAMGGILSDHFRPRSKGQICDHVCPVSLLKRNWMGSLIGWGALKPDLDEIRLFLGKLQWKSIIRVPFGCICLTSAQIERCL